eukprot:360262-Chlamydomonas_euryale.AAC.13
MHAGDVTRDTQRGAGNALHLARDTCECGTGGRAQQASQPPPVVLVARAPRAAGAPERPDPPGALCGATARDRCAFAACAFRSLCRGRGRAAAASAGPTRGPRISYAVRRPSLLPRRRCGLGAVAQVEVARSSLRRGCLVECQRLGTAS